MESHASCEAVVGDSELLVKKMAAICNAGPAKLQVAHLIPFVFFSFSIHMKHMFDIQFFSFLRPEKRFIVFLI